MEARPITWIWKEEFIRIVGRITSGVVLLGVVSLGLEYSRAKLQLGVVVEEQKLQSLKEVWQGSESLGETVLRRVGEGGSISSTKQALKSACEEFEKTLVSAELLIGTDLVEELRDLGARPVLKAIPLLVSKNSDLRAEALEDLHVNWVKRKVLLQDSIRGGL